MFSARKKDLRRLARQNNRKFTNSQIHTRILEAYTRNLIWYVHASSIGRTINTQLHKQQTHTTHEQNVTQTNRNALTKREKTKTMAK